MYSLLGICVQLKINHITSKQYLKVHYLAKCMWTFDHHTYSKTMGIAMELVLPFALKASTFINCSQMIFRGIFVY